jgi:hypothetical protein
MNKEIFEPFELCFKALKFSGLGLRKEQSKDYTFIGYFCHSILYTLLIVGLLNGVVSDYGNLSAFVFDVGLTTTVLVIIVKAGNYLLKAEQIQESVKLFHEILKLSDDGKSKKRDKLMKPIRFGFKFYKTLLFFAFLNSISSFFLPFFTHKLPFPLKVPFGITDGPAGFWITSVILLVYSIPTGFLNVTLDSLPFIFMSYATGLIEDLAEIIEESGRKDEVNEDQRATNSQQKPEYNANPDLIKCVEIHKKIKEFVSEIQRLFSFPIWVHATASSGILCSFVFSLSTVSFSFFYLFFRKFLQFKINR